MWTSHSSWIFSQLFLPSDFNSGTSLSSKVLLDIFVQKNKKKSFLIEAMSLQLWFFFFSPSSDQSAAFQPRCPSLGGPGCWELPDCQQNPASFEEMLPAAQDRVKSIQPSKPSLMPKRGLELRINYTKKKWDILNPKQHWVYLACMAVFRGLLNLSWHLMFKEHKY